MVWKKDELLCREVLLLEPYKFKARSRGSAWKEISEALNSGSNDELYFKADARAVRGRFYMILNQYKTKMRGETNASGINPEQTAHEALEELWERVESYEDEQLNTDKENSSKQEKEKLADDELRHKAFMYGACSCKRNG